MQNNTKSADAPKNVPNSIVAAVDAAVRAGQHYATAVANRRGLPKCEELMGKQKTAVRAALDLIDAELTRRYEGGIEMGRAQATASRKQ